MKQIVILFFFTILLALIGLNIFNQKTFSFKNPYSNTNSILSEINSYFSSQPNNEVNNFEVYSSIEIAKFNLISNNHSQEITISISRDIKTQLLTIQKLTQQAKIHNKYPQIVDLASQKPYATLKNL